MLLAGYKVLSWEELDLAANKRRHLSAKGGELTQTGTCAHHPPHYAHRIYFFKDNIPIITLTKF